MKKLFLIFILAAALTAGACGSAKTERPKAEQAETSVTVSTVAPSNETSAPEATVTAAPTATPEASSDELPDYIRKRAGTYYLNRMTEAGAIMVEEEVARVEGYGIDMRIDLNEDGTGVMKVFGEVWPFTWDEKNLQFEKETSEYLWLDERGLTFVREGIVYLFKAVKATDQVEAAKEKEEEQDTEDPDSPEQETEEEPTGPATTLEIKGADWVSLDGSKKKGLCVWYEYTNNTDGYLSPYAFTAEIIQDKETIQEGEIVLADKEEIPEKDFRYTEISAGSTNRSIHLFAADPDGGTIRYTVKDAGGTILIEQEFDPAKLPGRPKKDFVPEAVLDLDYLDDVPAKDVYEDAYEFAIKSAEVVRSETDGGKMIRVKFEFKNGSEEAVSPYLVLYLRAVQDGISLNPGWSSADDPALELIYEDVEPGETAKFYYEWHLISDSPVAVEIYDWFSEETLLGRAFEVSDEDDG